MSLLLCIETATSVCSVALIKNGFTIAHKSVNDGYAHSERLAVFIQELMASVGMVLNDLDAVAVSGGPGSYTGLRIGVSTAKGISWSLDKPLIAIPTLKSMAAGAAAKLKETGELDGSLLCPLIDARRMEVYSAVFDASLNEVKPVAAIILSESSFVDTLDQQTVWFFGDGMSKSKSFLASHPNARFLDEYSISACDLQQPVEHAFEEGRFEHVGLYEPFYFKEFVAGKGSVAPTNS